MTTPINYDPSIPKDKPINYDHSIYPSRMISKCPSTVINTSLVNSSRVSSSDICFISDIIHKLEEDAKSHVHKCLHHFTTNRFQNVKETLMHSPLNIVAQMMHQKPITVLVGFRP